MSAGQTISLAGVAPAALSARQLWETTMDPTTRTLLRVTAENLMHLDETFTTLMGSNVPPRKKFIETHAHAVRNLDV